MRKATFFANDEWIKEPFQQYRAAPMQVVLGLAARIPGILEKIDDPVNISLESAIESARERITELLEIRSCLESWHKSFLESSSEPMHWHRAPGKVVSGNLEFLWYRDLSTANVFTYLWSFQTICLTHIHILLERYPSVVIPVHMAPGGAKRLRDTCIELSVRIFQSMEYVLQKNFMLYGISSAHFPVQTACRALAIDEKGRAILGALDHTIVIRSKFQDV